MLPTMSADEEELAVSPKLLSAMKEALTLILEPKLAMLTTKEDLNVFKNEIVALRKENLKLRADLMDLKEANRKTMERMEELEVVARMGNLIFKGVKCNNDVTPEMSISNFCSEVLKVDIPPDNLRVRPLGRRDNVPLLTTFSHPKDRWAVLKESRILKGTGFSICEDLPLEVRAKKGKLLLLRKEILKLSPHEKVVIRSNKLLIKGVSFSWSSHDGITHGGKDGVPILSELLKRDFSDIVKVLSSSPPEGSPGEGDPPSGRRSPSSKSIQHLVVRSS